jgi:hypothetical protein
MHTWGGGDNGGRTRAYGKRAKQEVKGRGEVNRELIEGDM